jgi:Mitochondrial genome maintenance MGM101
MGATRNCDACKTEIADGKRRQHLRCIVEIYDQRGTGSPGEKAVHSLNRILGTGEWTIIPTEPLQVTNVVGLVHASGNFSLKVEGAEVAQAYGDAEAEKTPSEVAESAKLDALVRCLNQFRG